ncbi:primase-helicase family protein [Magnetococcales bacterium HHB-1]
MRGYSQKLYNKWVDNPKRKTVDRDDLIFDPTKPFKPPGEYHEDDDFLNMFTGLEMVPNPHGESGCQRILDHLDLLCEDDHKLKHWLLSWIAYPLQNLGKKMTTSIVVHGRQGTGKNFFWEAVAKIYGKYALVISQAELDLTYNDWASLKLFIIANEVVARSDIGNQKNKLKGLITDKAINIHGKFLPVRKEANHINLVFLSNEDKPVLVEEDDRRYVVLRMDHVEDKPYFDALDHEIENGGTEAFYYYLLHYPIDADFNEHTKPYHNDARRKLIKLSRESPSSFYDDWKNEKIPIPFCSCTAPDLYLAYKIWCKFTGEHLFKHSEFCTKMERMVERRRTLVFKPKLRGYFKEYLRPDMFYPQSTRDKDLIRRESVNFTSDLQNWTSLNQKNSVQ